MERTFCPVPVSQLRTVFLYHLAEGLRSQRAFGSRAKVDYKEVLKPEEFAVFARLRELRKEMAQAEAVPVYTIFTNEQPAQMVRSRATTKAALEKVAGVGDARIEKYGTRFLEVLAGAWQGSARSTPAALCGR